MWSNSRRGLKSALTGPAGCPPSSATRSPVWGIGLPWTHQAEAADLAHSGRDVMIATGTASGKSLGYLLPVLTALLTDPRACALYLAPTKALAADQLGSVQALSLSGIRASC